MFDAAWQFFDLTDFLTWKATGSLARSSCTVTCKWTYLAHERRWDPSYFRDVGLCELADEGFARIGPEVVPPGTSLGPGLTEAAAMDLGLVPGTAVAAGLIDAHAGGVGTVGAQGDPTGGPLHVGLRLRHLLLHDDDDRSTRSSSPGVWGPTSRR